jgi:hypothetical protein
MLLSAVWLAYRAFTTPEGLTHFARFVPDQTSAPKPGLEKKIAVLEDLGNRDGVSRLPAGQTPIVSFSKLKPHCPSLKNLKSNTWIEIDEMGQILSPTLLLRDCNFEPYRAPNGRPLSVRTLYTVAK